MYVLSGIGNNMAQMVTNVLVQKLFTTNRGFGGSCSMLGFSIGNLGGSVVVTYLIHEYGWRGSMLIMAGIFTHIIMFGTLYREPNNRKPDPRKIQMVQNGKPQLASTQKEGATNERLEELDSRNTVSIQMTTDESSSATNPEIMAPGGLNKLTNVLVDENQEDKRTAEEPLLLVKEQLQQDIETEQSQQDEGKENDKDQSDDQQSRFQQNSSGNAIKSFVADVFDCGLCKDYTLVVHCLCSMLWFYNLSVYLQHMPNKAVRLGMTKENVRTLMSVLAISVICCRVIVSIMANLKWINRMAMYECGIFVGGI